MPDPTTSLEAKIEAGLLSVRFDAGYWIVAAHGAKTVLSVEDRGADPRAASIIYRNTWGLTTTINVHMRTPWRLGLS